jgi:hypothetical protein
VIPEPMQRREGWTASAAHGCTEDGCGTQDTTVVDGFHGRRCDDHAPGFDPRRAVGLMVAGFPGAALAYVRTWA